VLTNASVANLSFDPEKVDAFELGAKYSRGGLSLTASAFHQRFDNFQLNTFDGTVYIVATINGCDTNLNGADRDASATTGACRPARSSRASSPRASSWKRPGGRPRT
jgi:iron complex outermembrane receptor protein